MPSRKSAKSFVGDGWKRMLVERKTGRRKGLPEVFYIPPNGFRKLGSLGDVRNYCADNKLKFEAKKFDFSRRNLPNDIRFEEYIQLCDPTLSLPDTQSKTNANDNSKPSRRKSTHFADDDSSVFVHEPILPSTSNSDELSSTLEEDEWSVLHRSFGLDTPIKNMVAASSWVDVTTPQGLTGSNMRPRGGGGTGQKRSRIVKPPRDKVDHIFNPSAYPSSITDDFGQPDFQFNMSPLKHIPTALYTTLGDFGTTDKLKRQKNRRVVEICMEISLSDVEEADAGLDNGNNGACITINDQSGIIEQYAHSFAAPTSSHNAGGNNTSSQFVHDDYFISDSNDVMYGQRGPPAVLPATALSSTVVSSGTNYVADLGFDVLGFSMPQALPPQSKPSAISYVRFTRDQQTEELPPRPAPFSYSFSSLSGSVQVPEIYYYLPPLVVQDHNYCQRLPDDPADRPGSLTVKRKDDNVTFQDFDTIKTLILESGYANQSHQSVYHVIRQPDNTSNDPQSISFPVHSVVDEVVLPDPEVEQTIGIQSGPTMFDAVQNRQQNDLGHQLNDVTFTSNNDVMNIYSSTTDSLPNMFLVGE